jgi:hypothetical protein
MLAIASFVIHYCQTGAYWCNSRHGPSNPIEIHLILFGRSLNQ